MNKLLLYCTKAKPYLLCEPYIDENKPCRILRKDIDKVIYNCVKENAINGKIVAECDFEVEEITYELYGDLDWQHDYLPTTNTMGICNLENASCLDRDEIENYLKDNKGYAIHIKNLHIFDEPRELYDCLIHPKIESKYYGCEHLSKAPQNMMYVELDDIRHILISIRPEWLCKILNNEKTIEVRKKVLREMIK